MFNKVLTHYREKAGIKKADLARKIDVSLTYIASLEAGRQKPPTRETCAKLADALTLNEHDRKELLELAVLERMKSADLETIKNRFSKGKQAPAPLPPIDRPDKVAILPWENANRKVTEDDIPIGLEGIKIETKVKSNAFALRIKDTSMAPEFQPGDIVVIDECPSPKDGDFVLASDTRETEPVLRQFKNYATTCVLHPLNAHFKDIVFDRQKRYGIIGKVVERVAKAKKY